MLLFPATLLASKQGSKQASQPASQPAASKQASASLRYMMNRNRRMWGLLKITDDPDSEITNEGACLRYMQNRNRPMEGGVYDACCTGIAQ